MDLKRGDDRRWYGALLEELPGRFFGAIAIGAVGLVILLIRACG